MSLWLANVTLETGESYYPDGSVKTETALFHIEISAGKIAKIIPATTPLTATHVKDMAGNLALPAFKEMHNHLDKTYLSLPWKSCRKVNGLQERLDDEALELQTLAETGVQRASAMIEKIIGYGANHIRTHINIDPYIGLKNLEAAREALDNYKEYVTADIIAFPQHGLLRNHVPTLMREALKNGATMIGGLDPAGIDRNIEASLTETMAIANEFNVDVDFHLHDEGAVGLYTIEKWMELVEEHNFTQHTAFSHAFSLGHGTQAAQISMAKRLQAHRISIMSTVPFNLGRVIPPIDLLSENGVEIHFGCDGFYDSWSPYGSGDILRKATTYAELTGKIEERQLRQSLRFITNGITPLDTNGQKQWPNIGDEASFVFLPASCSAEAIARPPSADHRQLMNKGNFFRQND